MKRPGHEATITARVCKEDGEEQDVDRTHAEVSDGCQFTPVDIPNVQAVQELRCVWFVL